VLDHPAPQERLDLGAEQVLEAGAEALEGFRPG
jgi:hypothetical protein